MALSLFHAMQALHILGSLRCVRELECPQTRRRIFWVQPLALFHHNSWQWGPAPSLSAVTFFVNCNSGAIIYHGVPNRPSQYHSTSVLSIVCLAQLIPGNAQNCSCSIMGPWVWCQDGRALRKYTKSQLYQVSNVVCCAERKGSETDDVGGQKRILVWSRAPKDLH